MTSDYRAVKESYERCCEIEGFLSTFYARFFEKSPAIPPLFAKTDFERQHRVLQESVEQMVTYATGVDDVARWIRVTAEIHSREFLDIKPEFYPLWLDSLCETVKECDPKYTPELEKQWRTAMQKGIDLMISAY